VKNVYALFAYGEERDGKVYDPYAQLMPVTNIADAHHDWESCYAKWGGSPSSSKPSSTPAVQPTPKSSSLSTPTLPLSLSLPSSHSSSSSPHSSSASDPLATGGNNKISGATEGDDKSDPVKQYLAAIVAGSILLGLAIIGGIVFAVRKMRKGRDGKGAYRGLGKQDDGGPVKVPLYDSEGASGRYGDGGQGRYTDPFKD